MNKKLVWEASARVRVGDPDGLHARPCAKIALTAEDFRSESVVLAGRQKARAISVLELLMLAAPFQTELEVRAEGPDAEACVAALVAVIAASHNDPGRK